MSHAEQWSNPFHERRKVSNLRLLLGNIYLPLHQSREREREGGKPEVQQFSTAVK